MAARREINEIRRTRRYIALNSFLSIILAFIFVCLANFCASRIYVRWHYDASVPGGLSPLSLDILAGSNGEITLTSLFERAHPLRKPVRRLLREYELAAAKVPGLSVTVKNIDINIDVPEAAALMKKYPVDPNSVIVTRGDRYRILSEESLCGTQNGRGTTEFFGEAVCTMAIRQLLRQEGISVYFLSGHGEYDPENIDRIAGASTLARILQEHGCSVKKLMLSESRGIPVKCDVLVVAGPRTSISEKEIRTLSKYLSDGGSVLFMVDSENAGNLAALLDVWNISVSGKAPRSHPDVATTVYGRHPVTEALSNTMTVFHDPCQIKISEALVTPEQADKPRVTPLVICGGGYGDQPFAVAAAAELDGINLSGKFHNARIIVCGDSDFISNSMLGGGINGNRIFIFSSIEWLAGFEGRLLPPSAAKPVFNAGIAQENWGKLAFSEAILLPIILLVCGVVVFIPLFKRL